MSLAIDVANVSKSFRRYRPDRPQTIQEVLAQGVRGLRSSEQFWALRDVSFSLPRGRAVGIIGTNGSGKSTLLRLVGGIGRADSGRIQVNGRTAALLDLGSGMHGELTGRENIIVAGVLSGLSRHEVLRRFDEIVAFSEIEKFIDNPMRTYSSGMQMRLAFSINVHTNPEVLLIDEVLGVGDAAFQRKCLARITQFKASGCSILLVSHGLTAVQALCDEVLWMNGGRLMARGPVRDVVGRYEAHVGYSMEPELASGPAAAVPTVTVALPELASPVPVPAPSAHAPADIDAYSSPRVQIVALGLLDGDGHPLTEFRAGQALRVAIDFANADAPATPRFRVRVVREDGLVCCDLVTEGVDGFPQEQSGAGRLTLVLDRLDLNSGHYGVDVAACFGESEQGDAGQTIGSPLVVIGDSVRDAVLAVPHRWELKAPVAEAVGARGEPPA